MTDKQLFDARAASRYDEGMEARVPGYRLAQELAGAVLNSALPGSARLLIVGAGTGSEILHLAKINPAWRFTALDVSQDMLDVAAKRLTEAGILDRVEFVCAPMQATKPLPQHDAGLVQLVGQFVAHAEKAAFYSAIAASLTPGAYLLSLDYRPALSPGFDMLREWALQTGAEASMVATMESRILGDWHIPAEPDLAGLWLDAGLKPEARYSQALAYVGTVLRREHKEC